MTLILQDWAGPAYQGGMILACFVFGDWLFLNGRLTNFALSVVGSATAN